MCVLVMEDEEYLAETVTTGLRREAMAVDVVDGGANVLEQVAVNDYDVIVLDRNLPVAHDGEVYRRVVRDHPSTRVLMLTTSRTLDTRAGGSKLGADNYFIEPFEFPGLVARLQALKRCSQPARTPILETRGVRLDPFRREVYQDERFIHLSPKEFAVFQVLMEAEGGVLNVEMLLERAWDANADPFTNSTRVTIFRLRRKLDEPWVIQAVPGAGYRFST